MKANELIIGGWYLLNNSSIKVEGYNRGNVYYDCGYECGLYELDPIPITKKMLTANGFHNRGEAGWQNPRLRLTVYIDDGIFVIGNPDLGDRIDLLHNVWHVHELQQFLMLCKREELADNIKPW